METDLCLETAKSLQKKIQNKEVSSLEVMEAHLARIKKVDPFYNAVVTLAEEEALAEAKKATEEAAAGQWRGPLHGLPVGIKDLDLTKGIRTTLGSPIHSEFIPTKDSLIVERYKAAGAIVVGKTNTPEFGAGSQTFNSVFGVTRNPYNPQTTCGGSSGGAAVALASGMLPLASGSDFGGSLRNPGNFCNVVGLRPSMGRVPAWPNAMPWYSMPVLGAMGRTAEDVALQFSALSGPDPRDPLSLPESGALFSQGLKRDFSQVKMAWTPDLGIYPVEPVVKETLEKHLSAFKDLGAEVEQAHPDVSGADEIFQTLRAWRFAGLYGSLLKKFRHQMKDTVIWNTEEGLNLTGEDVSKAEIHRGELYHRMRNFMENYEFLLLPVSPVPPFPVEQEYIKEIDGKPLKNYLDWMALCYCITLSGLPAASVPCGFTPEGLPVGLQIVGRHGADFSVLQLAHMFETTTHTGKIRPPEPTGTPLPRFLP